MSKFLMIVPSLSLLPSFALFGKRTERVQCKTNFTQSKMFSENATLKTFTTIPSQNGVWIGGVWRFTSHCNTQCGLEKCAVISVAMKDTGVWKMFSKSRRKFEFPSSPTSWHLTDEVRKYLKGRYTVYPASMTSARRVCDDLRNRCKVEITNRRHFFCLSSFKVTGSFRFSSNRCLREVKFAGQLKDCCLRFEEEPESFHVKSPKPTRAS